ncbi:ankyrin repeat-containing domain protein [Trichoderma novae-zelandiae]
MIARAMAYPKKTYGDYSVGWICALPKEQTAATAMLDEKHADLPKLTNDANTYTLGSIGPHNVVIACLPKGQYGTNSAANVASFMIRTFPSIKIGLMVGIGGGVPPRVRLGDVVVSTPTGQYPGVVQWDLGKATEGGNFERTGALSNPPGSLLTALTKLETEYELTGSKIPDFLEELKARFPRLAKKYLKADKLQDLLFQADYVHVKEPFSNMNTEGPTGGTAEVSVEEEFEDASDEDGDPCQFCDQSKLIKRRRRSIRVHHGLIASGNKVIKDGLLREKLKSALGGEALCFETEAAGLMNNFPCLVIRGICDYCDSHKNNAWQEHAAAVAAAFAKELLGCIQPSDFEGERLIRDVMSEVKQDVQRLYDVSVETKKHLDTFRDDNEAKKRIEILNWLSPLDFPLVQHDYFARCEPDTGQEFLLSEQVQSWISTSKQTLFCEGVPGAGKTLQMAILVNYLIEKFRYDGTVGIAYIYYNFKRHHDQKAEHMLASLVKQLAQNSRTFPEAVQKLHDRHMGVKTRPFLVELSETLAVLVQSFSRVFILIDALDEAEDSERTKLLDRISMMREKSGLNLFATSRAINTIAAKFEGSICREISPSRHDVFQVLNARMAELPSFVREDEGLQNEIKASIEAAMGGMFLLAQLYLNSFVGSRSVSSLKKSLHSLQQASFSSSSSSSSPDRSSVLDEAYDKSMERIQQLKGDLPRDAVLIISWIVKAKRQMKVTELQEALAVEIGASELDKDNIPTVDHIIQACASLVVIEGDGIELVHYTAQEYFERPDNQWMQKAHTYIANVCLTYLSSSDFRNEPCMSWEDRAKRIENCPFYKYSDANWAYHTNEALEQGFEVSKVIEFLEDAASRAFWHQNLLYGHRPEPFDPRTFPTQVTPLHIAAFFGLHRAVVHLLSQGFSPNSKDSDSHTPIFWAAFGGNARVAKLLLAITNVEMTDEVRYGDCSPLLIAAWMGHEAVVELLLDKYPIESNSGGFTALHFAAGLERQAVFDLLLERGANIETRSDELGQTPLAMCAITGCVAAVQWLVERGADIEARDRNNRTPLLWAAIANHENVIHYLVEKGANMEAKDSHDITPLLVATMRKNDNLDQYFSEKGGNIDNMDDGNQMLLIIALYEKLNSVTELFLRNGFDTDMTTHTMYTPLTLAIRRRAHDIVERLVERGADLNKADGHNKTPLLTAIKQGNKHIVQFLIEKGAGLELRIPGKGALDPTPLAFAAGEGRIDIVEMLIDKGADLEAQSFRRGTALLYASWRGHTDVIQLLLEKGADIEARCWSNNTAFIEASANGHENAIKLFLNHNANLEAKGFLGRTALSQAVCCNKPGAVRILLDSGADLEAEDNGGRTPLAQAVKKGNASILAMLLNSTAKRDYRGVCGQTLMHIAAKHKKLESVNALLACNTVQVDERDNKGRTPFSHVAECGVESIIKALLESDKVDANTKDDRGLAPLRYAMDRQDEDVSILRTLLDSEKVDVNAKDNQGHTPLLYAIIGRKVSIVKMLLDCERVDGNGKDDTSRTPLIYALYQEDQNGSILKALLNSGKVDVNARDHRGETALFHAIRRRDGLAIDALLESAQVDFSARDNQGCTPLFYAMTQEHSPCFEPLAASGEADVGGEDDEGRRPLSHAAEVGDSSILQKLLDSGKVNVNDKFDEKYRPLQFAICRGDASILRKLLKCGKVDLNIKDDDERTPLQYATYCKLEYVLRVLLDYASVEEVNAKDDEGRTPFRYAIELGDMSIIKTFLQCRKVNVNTKDDQGRTPLRYAVEHSQESIIRVLLDCTENDTGTNDDEGLDQTQIIVGDVIEGMDKDTNVDANAGDDQGRTPLLYAIQSVDELAVWILLESGKVDVNMGDNQGRTPLSYAMELRGQSIHVVNALLNHPDIDPNTIDDEGRTPISRAIQRADEDILRRLLDSRKVNVNIADKKGRTPLSYAMELRDKSAVKALLDREELEVEAKDDAGRTPLSYAASYDVARLLLKTGKVDVNSKDNKGRTPLWYAVKTGNQELEGLLRRRGGTRKAQGRRTYDKRQREEGPH